jgi:coenzyme Q-binding protein COQ10
MPLHHEQRILPYTADQLFELVSSVDRYPEFLPWCLASRITKRDGDVFWAELVIGFKMVRETFGSRVEVERPNRIIVEPTSGPFRRMSNLWYFTDLPGGGCEVEFRVDFEFSSRFLNKLIGGLYHEAVRKMVSSFESRARALYGPGMALAVQPDAF